jgi:major vault protein
MAGEREQNRDITLPPDSYLFLVNEGKGGLMTVHRGPTVVNQTGQDQPVKYNPATRQYESCDLAKASQPCPRANEGDYVVLENPAENKSFPTQNTQQAVQLSKGRKVIIPGPWSEALWPGQVATVVEGHRLRSNQYLVAIVYNAEEAEKNWESTVAVSQTDDGLSGETDPDKIAAAAAKAKAAQEHKKGLPKPESFAVGSRIVIKGSDVSFYIPCTGIEVQKDKDSKYVREAVTLEQLEYCCLVDENGKKEYPKGPKVVFPRPTQVFDEDKRGRRKFKPIELNNINGIHLKATADFEGPDIENDISKTRKFKEGEELFVTGKTLSIYYPREELAIIEYGQGNRKHFSTTIPKGEGRYLIMRETGEIKLITGPKMLLPDPRFQILVRRILSDDECQLWYPGNAAALAYNRDLAQAMAESPSGRSGVVSEGDYRKRQLQQNLSNVGGRKGLESTPTSSYGAAAQLADFSQSDDYSAEAVGDEGGAGGTIGRGTKYTQPRSLTLNTKFDGVPRVEIWPGYAVLIVGAEGQRRVAMGPQVVLLEYDEKLGFMKLSTGKPKSTDNYYKTSYLCVDNNQVGDIVAFESKDHVKGKVKISLRVNFEGETEEERLKWWGVDNYVKYLTDHVRSIIAGTAKRLSVAELKADYVNIVREAILGKKPSAEMESEPLRDNATVRTKRPGLAFPSNGMRVVEVEVLELELSDANIAKMLDQAQHKVVQTNIEIDQARKDLEATKAKETIEQEKARAVDGTAKLKRQLEKESIDDQITLLTKQLEMELKKIGNTKEQTEKREEITDLTERKKIERAQAEAAYLHTIDKEKALLEKEKLDATTAAAVSRFTAARDGLYEVMVAMQRDDLAVKLAQGCTIERWLSGDGVESSISNLLSIAPTLAAFFEKSKTLSDGKINRLKEGNAVATK